MYYIAVRSATNHSEVLRRQQHCPDPLGCVADWSSLHSNHSLLKQLTLRRHRTAARGQGVTTGGVARTVQLLLRGDLGGAV